MPQACPGGDCFPCKAGKTLRSALRSADSSGASENPGGLSGRSVASTDWRMAIPPSHRDAMPTDKPQVPCWPAKAQGLTANATNERSAAFPVILSGKILCKMLRGVNNFLRLLPHSSFLAIGCRCLHFPSMTEHPNTEQPLESGQTRVRFRKSNPARWRRVCRRSSARSRCRPLRAGVDSRNRSCEPISGTGACRHSTRPAQ